MATLEAPSLPSPSNIALLADQLKLLALNAELEAAAANEMVVDDDLGLKELATTLDDIDGILSRRPVTAEEDTALVNELGELSRSLTRTVTALET
jgi:methyl-accepting chemotaxis protein